MGLVVRKCGRIGPYSSCKAIQKPTRASYSHHYRRIVPALLEVLSFQCNNDLHRPVMDALDLLERYRGRRSAVFPASEKVPLEDVVSVDWQEWVRDDKHGGAVNRISYEWCVLATLRDKVRCKEVWVKGAHRFRNPDEDLPQDFDVRREEYYAVLEQPREARAFVEKTYAARWRRRSPLSTKEPQKAAALPA
jgi:hypothetical protein